MTFQLVETLGCGNLEAVRFEKGNSFPRFLRNETGDGDIGVKTWKAVNISSQDLQVLNTWAKFCSEWMFNDYFPLPNPFQLKGFSIQQLLKGELRLVITFHEYVDQGGFDTRFLCEKVVNDPQSFSEEGLTSSWVVPYEWRWESA